MVLVEKRSIPASIARRQHSLSGMADASAIFVSLVKDIGLFLPKLCAFYRLYDMNDLCFEMDTGIFFNLFLDCFDKSEYVA